MHSVTVAVVVVVNPHELQSTGQAALTFSLYIGLLQTSGMAAPTTAQSAGSALPPQLASVVTVVSVAVVAVVAVVPVVVVSVVPVYVVDVEVVVVAVVDVVVVTVVADVAVRVLVVSWHVPHMIGQNWCIVLRIEIVGALQRTFKFGVHTLTGSSTPKHFVRGVVVVCVAVFVVLVAVVVVGVVCETACGQVVGASAGSRTTIEGVCSGVKTATVLSKWRIPVAKSMDAVVSTLVGLLAEGGPAK